MKERTNSELVKVAIRIVLAGAREYLKAHKLTADMTALAECCRSWTKIQLPVALRDAKEALDANMGQVAEATFKASMFQAGIEAAKECGRQSFAAAFRASQDDRDAKAMLGHLEADNESRKARGLPTFEPSYELAMQIIQNK